MPNLLKSGKKPLEDKNELCSNKSISNAGVVTNPADWQQYKTSLSEIEKLSGFKILSQF
jgi:hypothetical protein